MMITQDVHDTIVKMVYEDLTGRFKGEIEFGPIDIQQEIDQYGDPYLHIRIVFDGDQGKLDSKWTSGLIARLLPQLVDLGIKHVPHTSFFGKEDWESRINSSAAFEVMRRKFSEAPTPDWSLTPEQVEEGIALAEAGLAEESQTWPSY